MSPGGRRLLTSVRPAAFQSFVPTQPPAPTEQGSLWLHNFQDVADGLFL